MVSLPDIPWRPCCIGLLCGFIMLVTPVFSEEVRVVDVVQSAEGTMEIRVDGQADHYYILYRSLDLAETGEVAALALGTDGPVRLKDRFAPRPNQVFYRVREVPKTQSEDTDGDGRLDYNELGENLWGQPRGNALNPVDRLKGNDGSNVLTRDKFEEFSVGTGRGRGITEGLTGERFMKFIAIPSLPPGGSAVLFMNTGRYPAHHTFLTVLAEKYAIYPTVALHGELAWIPQADGESDGWYVYNLQPGDLPALEEIRMLFQILTNNIPFVDGNLAYRPWGSSLSMYLDNDQFQRQLEHEGIPVWLDFELSGYKGYAPLNEGETYGLLRVFDGDERPSILDVALYLSLPNDVPLLRGIITETPQTPLSHVNLRAVQNHNPNAFIQGASVHPDIEPLIGKYVHYVVRADGFEITEATKDEVEAHLEANRPTESQKTPRNLFFNRNIQSLSSLGFEHSDSIGAKAANLAELVSSANTIGIPRKALPPFGYAIPFYYYDEFMKHNGFYEVAETMMDSKGFANPAIRSEALKKFRRLVRGGLMPEWMLNDLAEVQERFIEVPGIRCRSSTNNEDLLGFNGAGLYESYTHYPEEGHLSKSIKQVYASLWTFIAFEHREFYRVDHQRVAMGVLMHPNYQDEIANGVAVSRYDAIQIASHPYYANVQVGEDLVTNPNLNSRPEELLLPLSWSGTPIRLGASNQVPLGTAVLHRAHMGLLGTYLRDIVVHFGGLYQGNANFAMEIEFKVTKDNQLIIKQARPWVN